VDLTTIADGTLCPLPPAATEIFDFLEAVCTPYPHGVRREARLAHAVLSRFSSPSTQRDHEMNNYTGLGVSLIEH
jgi:hypothetical protein